MTEYNIERPHESLNNLAPEEYRMNMEISKSAWNYNGYAYKRPPEIYQPRYQWPCTGDDTN